MQNSKNLLILLCICLGACSSQREAFDTAIQRSQSSSVRITPKPEKGLPYFLTQTLTPTWQAGDSIVRIPPFSFQDQKGRNVSEQIFSKRLTIVGFFFTSCTGYCPILVKKLKTFQTAMGNAKDVQFVLFSVDPEVDTPAKLQAFAKKVGVAGDDRWTFLTGPASEIYQLARNTFSSEVRQLNAPEGLRKFAHTEHFYFMDRSGRLRTVLNGMRLDTPQLAAQTLKNLRASEPALKVDPSPQTASK